MRGPCWLITVAALACTACAAPPGLSGPAAARLLAIEASLPDGEGSGGEAVEASPPEGEGSGDEVPVALEGTGGEAGEPPKEVVVIKLGPDESAPSPEGEPKPEPIAEPTWEDLYGPTPEPRPGGWTPEPEWRELSASTTGAGEGLADDAASGPQATAAMQPPRCTPRPTCIPGVRHRR
ncbi:MAG: hypothetical protein VKS61_06830 [Candidatus Sericytochromatia bacterium]|nr:hypothetical protein [Candidatus Sericytochromatia bacterium]